MEYSQATGTVKEAWREMPIAMGDIEFNTITFKPYFYSLDDARKRAQQEKYKQEIGIPCKQLEGMILEDAYEFHKNRQIASALQERNLFDKESFDESLSNFLKALFSIRDNKVHFRNQDGKWGWLVNYVWQHHIHYWVVFLYSVEFMIGRNLFLVQTLKSDRKERTLKGIGKSIKNLHRTRNTIHYFHQFSQSLKNHCFDLKTNYS